MYILTEHAEESWGDHLYTLIAGVYGSTWIFTHVSFFSGSHYRNARDELAHCHG